MAIGEVQSGTRMKTAAVLALILATSCVVSSPRPPLKTAAMRLERDVRFLASDEMKGRDNATPEGAAAGDYMARRMAEAGLQPAGEKGTWFQTIPGRKGDRGRNVIGALPGSADSWVVIGAHYDGLGVRRGAIHNGADDNASGAAVLLEVARRLKDEPRGHGYLFCSFDAEEDGLVGSTHFVNSGLYATEKLVAMICLDLVGGSFLPGDERRVFALGSESSDLLFGMIGSEREKKGPIELERLGIYAIEPFGALMARSDYSPFRLKKVPFVFLSTGTPWYYHTAQDDMERLDFGKMEAVAALVSRLAENLSCHIVNPAWRTPAPDLVEDARQMAAACRRVLEHPAIRASDRLRASVAKALEELGPGGEGGVKAVQRAVAVLFELAAAQKPAH